MDRPWRRRVIWILVGAVVTGLFLLLAASFMRMINDRPPDLWWLNQPLQAVMSVLLLGALSLPAHVMNVFVALKLRKIDRDTLFTTSLSGGLITLVWFLILAWSFLDTIPDIVDVLTSFAIGAIPASLYWRFVVRLERAIARQRDNDANAIRAME